MERVATEQEDAIWQQQQAAAEAAPAFVSGVL